MKRPLCVIGLTLALTTLVALLFVLRVALLLSVACFVTALLLYAIGRRRTRTACLVLLTMAVGLGCCSLHERRVIRPLEALTGQTVTLEGLITESDIRGRSAYYTVRTRLPGNVAATVRLRAYGELEHLAGDVVAAKVRLDDALAAPGEYGYAQGLYLSGLVTGEMELRSGYPVQGGWIRLRERMCANIYNLLEEESAHIVTAMVLGAGDSMDPQIYSDLNRAGTAHLLSVSGLHLSILVAVVLGALEGMGLSRRRASLAGMVAAGAFSLLVGLSASMTRAFVMTAVTLLARMSRRSRDSLSALGLAVTVICIVRPAWLLGRGFWFSALSTLGILVVGTGLAAQWRERVTGSGKRRLAGMLADAAGISVGAYLFTLPLSALFNGWLPLLSPVVNTLLAPFETPLIAGGIFCAVVGGRSLPMRVVAAVVEFCVTAVVGVSRFFGRLPIATISLDEGWMLIWFALAAVTVTVIFLWRQKELVRYAAVLLVLVFGVGALSQLYADREFVELSVMEGCDTPLLVRDGEAAILGTPTRYEINRLLRYLEHRGVDRIRAVVATDCGEQIDSGLLRLADTYPVDCVIGPNDEYILNQLAMALPETPVYSGGYASLELLGGVNVSVLLPNGDILARTAGGTVLKSTAKYDIMEPDGFGHIRCYPDGVLVLDGAGGYDPVPLGGVLYGERRFRLWCPPG